MNACEVTMALGGSWHGHYGVAKCPCHDDKVPSLQISDGDNGDLLVFCHAGCSWQDIKAVLRGRGLLPEWWPTERTERQLSRSGGATSAARRDPSRRQSKTKYARKIWFEARPTGDIARNYLTPRRITLDLPPSLREHPALRHRPTGLTFPCLVAGVQRLDGRVVAVERFFLTPDCTKKAAVPRPKMLLGPFVGNAVRLGPAAEKIALAEGLENGLSVHQSCPELPVWCGLSATNLAPCLPKIVKEVVMCLDGDLPGSPAFRLSEKAIQELLRRGLKVRVFRAPPGIDYNDLLQQQANAVPLKTEELADV